MNLTAVWVGPGTPANNSTVQWQIGGKVAKEFWISADDSVGEMLPITFTSMPYVASNGSSNVLSFIWYAAPFQGEHDNVSCTLAGSTETVKMTVGSPEATITVDSGNSFYNGIPITVAGTGGVNPDKPGYNIISSGNLFASLGQTGPAIVFNGYAKEPFSLSGGTYEWVQIVSGSYAFESGFLVFHKEVKSGLDTSYPYNASSSFPTQPQVMGPDGSLMNPVQPTPQVSDLPYITSARPTFGKHIGFTMTLMYEPAGASAYDWVPLVSVPWAWYAEYSDGRSVYNRLYVFGVRPAQYPSWISIVHSFNA
jgi:hypothetical protein